MAEDLLTQSMAEFQDETTVIEETATATGMEEYQILLEQEETETQDGTHEICRPFACPICDKGFTRKGDMIRHHRKHTGEKPYVCPECNDEFTRKDDMVRHLRAHQGIKPHQCPVCNRKFGRKTDMVKHLLIHAGIKACGCPTCGCPFSHQGKGVKKTCAFTSNSKIFCCPECDETFLKKRELTQHYQINHTGNEESNTVEDQNDQSEQQKEMETEEPLEEMAELLEASGSSDNTNQNQDPKPNLTPKKAVKKKMTPAAVKALNKLIASTPIRKKPYLKVSEGGAARPFECPQCADTFSRKADMLRHNMLHSGVKPHQCPSCPKSFSRKDEQARHTLTHLAEKPFHCNICNKGFIRKSEFVTHMLKHAPKKRKRVEVIIPN